MRRAALAAAIVLSLTTFASAYELDGKTFKVALEVRNPSPFARTAWPVTSGVPFPEGVLTNPANVKVVDANGKDVPCQFRVLSRYWLQDKSVKWLLVDLQANVPAKGKTTYHLMTGAPPAAKSALTATKTAAGITVDTGMVKVEIPAKGFRLLNKVWFDVDGNGAFAADELMVDAGKGDGLSVSAVEQEMLHIKGTFKPWGSPYVRSDNPKHAKHFAGEQTWKVPAGRYDASLKPLRELKIEEAGPMRVVVLVRGTHWPTKSSGLAAGLYDFTCRLTFFAGKPFVQVEHSVDNSRLDRWLAPKKALWLFNDLMLSTSFKLGTDAKLTGGLERQADHRLGSKAIFNKPDGTVFTAPAGDRFEFYQDSLGGKMWNRHQPFMKRGTHPSKMRGYKITRNGKSVATGDRLDGWVDLSDKRWGCTVGVRNMYLRFPKAFEIDGPTVHVSLFPRQYSHNWRVDFGERVGHTIFYAFHGPAVRGAKLRERYEALNQRLFARAEPAWYADTRAIYADFGTTTAKVKRKAPFGEDGEWLDPGEWGSQPSVGLRAYGRCGGFNSGGRHRHVYSLFKTYLLTGATYDLNAALETGRWCANQIPWVVDNFTLDGGARKLQALFDATMMGPKNFYVAKENFPTTVYKPRDYLEGPCVFYAYKGAPDQEHRGAVPAMDYYLFTGSQAAYEQIVALGNRCCLWDHWCLFNITAGDWNDRGGRSTYQQMPKLPLSDVTAFDRNKLMDERWGYYSRVYGWQALSIMQAFEVTGNPVYDFYNNWRTRKLLRQARFNDGLIDSTHGKSPVEKPWMTGIMIHGVEHAYKQTRREALRDLVIGFSDNQRLEFDYQPGKGFPYNLKITDRSFKARREWQALASLGLAYGYLYTGHNDYLPMLAEWLRKAKPGNEVNVPAYYGRMGAANYVTSHPRKDTTPPAVIADLKARVAGGKIALTWTAPKDNGGVCREYQVKLARKPLVEHAGWARRKTHRSFWGGENVSNEPAPKAAGAKESLTIDAIDTFQGFGGPAVPVSKLARGTWYIAIKTWDAAGNLGPISNVVTTQLK
jgi:exo-rhamnogalacturonan lyase-like protein